MTTPAPDLAAFQRPMTTAETTAHARYLSSVQRGSRPIDAAQHAIAQMLRGDVRPDFVTWLSQSKLRITDKGRITRRAMGQPARPILSVDQVWGGSWKSREGVR